MSRICIAVLQVAGEMQEIPVKKSDAVSFTRALSQFVVNSYSVDASIYSDDFKDLDKLRADAISDNSLKSMFRYYTQLSGISVKFPLNEDSGIKLSFAWYSIFGGCYSCYSIDHDKASILFNIGATYSLLGKESDRSSDSGLKSAVHHFQNAAGVFKHLAESINTLKVPLYNDFSKLVLESFQNQMLAQAQECFFLKSLSLKDVLIARISRKVSELYTTSYKLATETNSFSKVFIH